MESKKQLRKKVLAKRKELSESYYQDANQIIVDKLLEHPEFKKAKSLFLFMPMPYEFNTKPVIKAAHEAGKITGIPRVAGPGDMRIHEYAPGDKLISGPYNIEEPASSAKELGPADIDLVIMPCVTCNNKGERLGYGGGFYDRFLKEFKGTSLLPFYSRLQVEDIPTDQYDQKIDIIMTEKGTFDLRS